ncbi:TIGR03986 family type III CRISPR-associated RAMP protein [Veillonella criceti]|uniref:CRISPR-associated protein n=1 Tax=Veillonella criceti TaxID=103891 RepID=A0A380NKS5_9FIRM|nr:TIGR03986 family CRISPR-associated RAMP protein [Veillonella criceti]SUP43056.1 CRISPR-associated protein [Veillonella criceti]
MESKNSKKSVNKVQEISFEKFATSPYNFVPLPKKVVVSPLASSEEWKKIVNNNDKVKAQAAYKSYVKEYGCYSGYIDLKITNKSPLYIGGSDDFASYSPAGVPIIPGSSLRGMVKNIFKILSCSAMRTYNKNNTDGDVADRHLYFRAITSISLEQNEYSTQHTQAYYTEKLLGAEDKRGKYAKPKSGFLVKIRSSSKDNEATEAKYFIFKGDSSRKRISDDKNYPKIDDIGVIWDKYSSKNDSEKTVTCKIITGNMSGKKHYYTITCNNFSDTNRIEVPKSVVEDYYADYKLVLGSNTDMVAEKSLTEGNRKRFFLFSKAEKHGGLFKHDNQEKIQAITGRSDIEFIIPCFYSEENNKVVHFGHGHLYRIAYDKSIGEHIPKSINSNVVDFTDAMFGKKEWWASRVFFSDASLEGDAKYVCKEAKYPKALMSPNPTSHQLYLNQPDKGGEINHWGKSSGIRGYKLYWHQQISKNYWCSNDQTKFVNGTKKIRPLDWGNKFSGKIYFNELTDLELGALLEVFNQKQSQYYFKIGQGKSIGLGSIMIVTNLVLDDLNKRYSALLGNMGFEEPMSNLDQQSFVDKFNEYRKEQLGDNASQESFNKTKETLLAMMNWNGKGSEEWLQKVAYMTLSGDDKKKFTHRIPLKPALEFESIKIR